MSPRKVFARSPRYRGLRDAVSVEIYTAEPGPMGVAGPEVSGAVKELLRQKGIPYHTGTERFDGHGGCFVEVGGGKAAFGDGDFYAEPTPAVKLRALGRYWHFGKVLFEKTWLTFKF